MPPMARCVRIFGRRATPGLIIKPIRNGLLRALGKGAMFHHIQNPDVMNVSEFSGVEVFLCFMYVWGTARLHAYLYDPFIFAGGFYHFTSFPYIMAEWFFTVHIFPCLTGHDGSQSMPMVRRSINDGIDHPGRPAISLKILCSFRFIILYRFPLFL